MAYRIFLHLQPTDLCTLQGSVMQNSVVSSAMKLDPDCLMHCTVHVKHAYNFNNKVKNYDKCCLNQFES